GIKAMKAESGIVSTVKEHGIIENIRNVYANNAEKNIKPDTRVYQSFVIKTVKQRHLGPEERRVYDLTVKDEHCYFANGLLVHNCLDAVRYHEMMNIGIRRHATKARLV